MAKAKRQCKVTVSKRGNAVRTTFSLWLIMRFGRLGQEGMEERFQQAFATDSGVVHELEEAQIEREFFL